MSHLTRRGAVYHWRRRFGGPALGCPAGIITLSLFTKEKAVARKRAAELTLMSETLSEEVERRRLRPEEAKAVLVAVARKHMAKLDLHATYERQQNRPGPMSGERADRVVGAAYRLLAERGRRAGLAEDDTAFLASCGLGAHEGMQINELLSYWRREGLVPPRTARLVRLLEEHAPAAEPNALTLAKAETLYYRGMAAACFKTGPRWNSTLDGDLTLLDDVDLYGAEDPGLTPPARPAPTVRAPPSSSTPVTASTPGAPILADPNPAPELASVGIVSMAESLIALKQKKRERTDKTGSQMRQTASLLEKITGREAVTQLSQADLALFSDTLLLKFPKRYGRSSRDAAKPIEQLLAEARDLLPEERGLEGTTVNRHLTHLGNLFEFAAGRGVKALEPLNLATLRSPKNGRDRDARPPFSFDQLVMFFACPIWRGSLSESERLASGATIIQDALYWATPIGVYSLMRREEICGLMIADVAFDAPIPYIEVRPNRYRRLKNAQSKRRIPIHPELIRLGLAAYVKAIAELGYDLLFPELIPASGAGSLGDQLYDDWLPALRCFVPGASEAGVVFHSIRHFGNHRLIDARVLLEWRQDILGHGGRVRRRSETGMKLPLSAS